MNGSAYIFDRHLVAARRARVAGAFAGSDFLFRAAADRLLDRLLDLKRRFATVLDLGCHDGLIGRCWPSDLPRPFLVQADLAPAMAAAAAAHGPVLAADEEALPLAPASVDAVLSCLSLHWVNDLPGTLVQVRRILRPDGLFLASLPGADTLGELREVIGAAEIEITGGVSPRISPFADMPDLGALLQRAGFALPVVDSDVITVRYADPLRLMADLRGMGETNALNARHRLPTRRSVLVRASALYRERFGDATGTVPATFRILTMTGWAPDATQQRPLRPGAATARLADALNTVEHPTGETPAGEKPDR